MNKTFKIVKNSLGQYVVAGEFAKSKSRSQTATKALLLSALSALSLSSYASIVRDDVDYQEFRNFAENKGKYQVGAVNIPVYDKSGKYLGTVLPAGVPMPDFSVANSQTAVATLINSRTKRVINSSQYVGTVAHNTDEILNNLRFGDARAYHIVNVHRASDIWLDDNRDYDESIKSYQDFATPKLSKMVTSTTASEAIADKGLGRVIVGEGGSIDSRFLVSSSSTNADYERISDLNDIIYSSDYTAIARLGSGSQYMLDIKNDKSIEIGDAYAYVTGGSPMLPMGLSYDLVMTNSPQAKNYLEAIGKVLPSLTLTREKGSPLISINLAGDSGSPLFTYNKNSQR